MAEYIGDPFAKCYTCPHNPETCDPKYDCPKEEIDNGGKPE